MPRTTIAEELQELRSLTSSGTARDIRVAAFLSQADIARSIGTDPSTVARWERGERMPRGDVALKYRRLLAKLSQASVLAP